MGSKNEPFMLTTFLEIFCCNENLISTLSLPVGRSLCFITAGCTMSYKLQELVFFTKSVLSTLCGFLWEYFTCAKQLTMDDLLDAKLLSSLIKRTVIKVENKSDAISLGGGGTGTVRFGLIAHLDDGSKLHLFVKTPTGSLFERVFLTVFRVYDNEFNFYANIRSLLPDVSTDNGAQNRQLTPSPESYLWCPKVYHARMQGLGRFLLVLEDVSHREDGGGCEFQSILDPYTQTRARAVLKQLASLHAFFWRRPPPGVWAYSPLTGLPLGQTPPVLRFLFEHAMQVVQKKYGHLVRFSPEVLQAFDLILANFPAVRRFWSRGPLTLCHGDAHIGNMFFYRDSGAMGFVDMQCVAAEHCSRDVAYHLINSCPQAQLVEWEKPLLEYYLSELHAQLRHFAVSEGRDSESCDTLSYEEFHFQYRVHVLWAFMAWVICCGTSELVLEVAAVDALTRTAETCTRLNSLGALQQVLRDDKKASKVL